MAEIHSQKINSVPFDVVKQVQGEAQIKADYSLYLTDESKTTARTVEWLFFPKNEAELAAVVQEMSARQIPVTVAGSRTGLVGGCVPDAGALISMEHFDQITSIDFDENAQEWRATLQANVSLKSLQEALKFKRFPGIENCANPHLLQSLARFKNDPYTYFYPPDPTEMSAAIAGTAATNASGARTFRYGPTRDWIRSLRVLLMNGEVLEIPRGRYFASTDGKFTLCDSHSTTTTITVPDYNLPKIKNAAGFYVCPGMDLIDLFIGSEGVLGILCEVQVALLKQQPKLSMVQFLASDEQAVELTIALRSNPALQLDFLEFYSGNALNLLRQRQSSEFVQVGMPHIPAEAGAAIFFELNFDPRSDEIDLAALQQSLLSCGADAANSWVAYEPRELERLKAFRHLLPETVNGIIAERKKLHPGIHKLGTDLSVPDDSLRTMWRLYRDGCNASGLEWLAFGHIGNNHLHVNILPRDEHEVEQGLTLYTQFAQKAVALGGSVSAEHGIGKLKRKFFRLMFTPTQVEQMKRVKAALDPLGLLNPGNLFEDEKSV